MADTFLGPIIPGNPLIMGGGGMPSQKGYGGRTSKTSTKKEDDIDALFGQTLGYKNMQSEIGMQKSMLKMSLFNMLKNKHQGNYNNFMHDPEAVALIKAIHQMDALNYANRNAIEQEKTNYKSAVEQARSNEAFDNYASDSRGNRFYIDPKTGQLKRGNSRAVLSKGNDFLKVRELYEHQRRNLGFDRNGVAQQGEWVSTIDNKQGYFKKDLKEWLKNASGNKDESMSMVRDKNHPDGLYGTNSPSFILSQEVYSSNNYKQVMSAANSIKTSLSREALKDAKQEFWDAHIDETVMLQIEHKDKRGKVTSTEIAYVSPEDYERYKKGIINDPSEEIFLNAKRVTGARDKNGKIIKANEEGAKFNIWLVQQAREIMNPYLKKSVKYSPSYHKLTEAQVGSYYEGKKQSGLLAMTTPQFITKNGNEMRYTLYNKVQPTGDGREIYKREEVVGSRIAIQGNSATAIDNFNKTVDVYKSNGKLDHDKLQKYSVYDILGGQPIVIDGIVIDDVEILQGLKIMRMNKEAVALPNLKQGHELNSKNQRVPNGKYDWDKGSEPQSYFSYQVFANDDVIFKLENIIAQEGKPLDSSYRQIYEKLGGGPTDYTISGAELDKAWFGIDPSNVADDKHFEEVSVGGLHEDGFSFSILTPTNPTIGFDKSSGNATIHNLEYYNATTNSPGYNSDNVVEHVYGQ